MSKRFMRFSAVAAAVVLAWSGTVLTSGCGGEGEGGPVSFLITLTRLSTLSRQTAPTTVTPGTVDATGWRGQVQFSGGATYNVVAPNHADVMPTTGYGFAFHEALFTRLPARPLSGADSMAYIDYYHEGSDTWIEVLQISVLADGRLGEHLMLPLGVNDGALYRWRMEDILVGPAASNYRINEMYLDLPVVNDGSGGGASGFAEYFQARMPIEADPLGSENFIQGFCAEEFIGWTASIEAYIEGETDPLFERSEPVVSSALAGVIYGETMLHISDFDPDQAAAGNFIVDDQFLVDRLYMFCAPPGP